MRYIKILLIVGLVALLTNCEDYLDLAPELGLTEDVVFDNYESTRGYLDRCFPLLNDHTHWNRQRAQRAHPASLADEAAHTYVHNSMKSIMNTGDWYRQSSSLEVGYTDAAVGGTEGRVIPSSFAGIRVSNVILEKVPDSELTQEQKDKLVGQAYFFRSWFYFEIIRRWGGMPVFDEAYNPDDEMDMERLDYQESTEWLIEGLNHAIELLPDEWPLAKKGRPTKVAAMSVKSMAALYAASPLMRNEVHSLNQYTDYDQEWSERAAEYAHDVIEYIETELPARRLVGEGAPAHQRDSLYRHIFYHRPHYVSEEGLWYFNNTNIDRDVHMSIHFQNSRWSDRPGNWGWAVTTPSQNLVDMHEVINPDDGNAYPIDHPNSGYDPQDPYANRDPRFYNNILPPGWSYGLDASGNPIYLEPWEGGQDWASDWTRGVPTGYFFIKFVPEEAKGWNKPGYNLYNYSCIFIRTTQIYLDYAEAMNEAYGPNADPHNFGMTALDAVNRIRERVGMPPVLAEYSGSTQELRERIRNERAVELSYEAHRWFDVRRWMIAEDLFEDTYPIKGMQLRDLTPEQADVSLKEFEYEVVPVQTEVRVFSRRHYWYPVAADHTDQLGNFRQNPGW